MMIEAMACGTPVIAFPGGSVAEVVSDGISGYVCASPDEMVERIKNLSIPNAIVRQYAKQYFSVERMAKKYLSLYESLRDDVDVVLPEAAAISLAADPGTAA